MELSPGVMRAFNEIITKDYLLFFTGLLKGPVWWEDEQEAVFFNFFPLLHSEWLRVCQSGSCTICGWHESLQGATRSDWESRRKEGRKRIHWLRRAALICLNVGSCSHARDVRFYFILPVNVTLWCIAYLLSVPLRVCLSLPPSSYRPSCSFQLLFPTSSCLPYMGWNFLILSSWLTYLSILHPSGIKLYLTCPWKSYAFIASGETHTMDVKFNEQHRQITGALQSIILFDWVLNRKINVFLAPVHL